MMPTNFAQACQRRPSIGHRVVGFTTVRIPPAVRIIAASHVNLAIQNGRRVTHLGSRHRCYLLPAVGCRVVHVHAPRGYHRIVFTIRVDHLAAQHVDLTREYSRSVQAASHGQARHPSPRTGDGVVRFDCVEAFLAVAVATADRIDLACYRRDCQELARSRHARKRLPAVGLRVVHLRFSKQVPIPRKPTHDVELATQSRSAVGAALRCHAGDLAPRIERRVVGPYRADLSPSFEPTHQVDQARPEAQAAHRLQSTDGHHCLEQHALSFDREQRWPRANGDE
eukprot:scaffold33462_cov57-Phaeocystis_antarctica.AAC.1